jgi:hypothetical protein
MFAENLFTAKLVLGVENKGRNNTKKISHLKDLAGLL